MKTLILTAILSTILQATALADCATDAHIVDPVIPESVKTGFELKLKLAKADYAASPASADAMIWYGRRLAYLGKYKEAIRTYTEGIKKHAKDARFLRHRGHRFITIRCFDDAIKDLKKASSLVKDKPDEVEPDGLPNAKNIPTSTLQSNIWYHLGLAYYLKGDFVNALKAYRECEKVSKNPDMLVATTNWLFVTLKRLGRDAEAERTLVPIADALEIIENDGYYQMIRMYKGEVSPADLAADTGEALTNATTLFGVGNWELINGRRKDAIAYFERVLRSDQWSSFGYIAAEAEMERLSN